MSRSRTSWPWKVIDTDTREIVYTFASQREARVWASVHNADEYEGTGRRGRYRVERRVS